MESNISVINVLKTEDRILVSSKEVAEKFGKRHDNVLRDIRELQVSEKFHLLNFEEIYDKDAQGREYQSYLMTRDGFSMLAFGFTGKEAMAWKESFLDAFTMMETAISEELPILREENHSLKKEVFLLTQQVMQLPAPKKIHGNKNTIIVPVQVNTIFGPDIEYKRVDKECEYYSDIARNEGELKRLSNLAHGMLKKISYLTDQIAIKRRN